MRRNAFLLRIVLFLVCSFCLLTNPVGAVPANQGQVVMLIVDNISYDDIVQYGGVHLYHLLENGALGLANTNSGGSYLDANSYATIGAGNYAVCSSFGIYAGGYHDHYSREPVNIVYFRNTGREMLEGNISNVDLPNLERINRKLNHPIKVGLLGSLLQRKGLKTAVIGNENTRLEETEVRAALITMNDQGVTNYGRVDGGLLKEDPASPFGLKTDYELLFQTYKEMKEKAHFIVIQTGDTHRLNKYHYFSDERRANAKKWIFQEVDLFLGRLLETLDDRSLFLFVVPFPSSEDIQQGKKLTPVIAYGQKVPKGLLTSSTTKRDGLITNTDLAAEIISFFQINRDLSMTGHHFQYREYEKALEFVKNLEKITVYNYKNRPGLVRAFITFIIIILFLSIVVINLWKDGLVYLKPFLTAVMIIPTTFLVIPLFQVWDYRSFVLLFILLTAVFSIAVCLYLRDSLSIIIPTLISPVLLILLDTFLGNPLMKVSILGYDPIGGARFYGIGNEYMGFLLGSTIIGSAALVDKYRQHRKHLKLASVGIFCVVLFTLAMPFLGTNVGGTMAAFIGFGTASLLMFKQRIRKKDLAVLVLLLLIFLVFLFIYDGMRGMESRSHIGQTSSLIQESSPMVLLQIFKRKLLMNYKLIRYSTWTLVLLAVIIVLAILFRWPLGILKEIFRRHTYLYYGFIAGLVGTIAAFVFNDSGVVAAAMSMIPIGISLILMCVDEVSEQNFRKQAAHDCLG
ncbi:MAG: phosphoglyceromutase [Bacillota bacterium]